VIRHEHVIPSVGDPRQEWCPHCCKTTLVMADIYVISSEAAYRIGRYGLCHECGWSPFAEKSESSG
jgi:hypothetical protein